MNAQLLTHEPASSRSAGAGERFARPARDIVWRSATAAEATSLHALIESHLEQGRLLPRDREELALHADRFVIAIQRGRIVGCAFAHDAACFARMGFSIVPHTWVPEKIARDCATCPQFRRCGQHALVLPLDDARQPRVHTYVPLASLRG